MKPWAAGCCGTADARTEPNVKPAPAGADDVVVVVVRENGVAEAVGLLKAKLKPVDAAVVAGVPNVRPVVGAAALEAGVLNENPPVGFCPKRLPPRPRDGAVLVVVAAAVPKAVPKEKPPVLAAGALVAAPNENPPPALVDPRVPDPKLKPDILC